MPIREGMCYGRRLLHAWLHLDQNIILNKCAGGEFSLAKWLWYWLCVQDSEVRIPTGPPYIFAMHLFVCFFVTDFVGKEFDYQPLSCRYRACIYRVKIVDQDQTTYTCSPILLCTLWYSVISFCQQNPTI